MKKKWWEKPRPKKQISQAVVIQKKISHVGFGWKFKKLRLKKNLCSNTRMAFEKNKNIITQEEEREKGRLNSAGKKEPRKKVVVPPGVSL